MFTYRAPHVRLAPGLLVACLISAAPSHAANGNPAEIEQINELMRRAGCLMCHRWDRPWIGPSFQEIAKSHRGLTPADRELLVQRLRRGSVGNHTPVPMSPCDPSRASDEELRRLLDHVLNHGEPNEGRKR